MELKTVCGKTVVFDDDFPEFLSVEWRLCSWGYAHSKLGIMHRIVMKAPKGMEVDHINHDPLDNRRTNLRLCTRSENLRNRRMQCNNTSGYKGVRLECGRWRVQISLDGKNRHIGFYDSPEEGYEAYVQAAALYHGEFACPARKEET